MLNPISLLIFTCAVLTACNETGKYYGTNRTDSTATAATKADSTASHTKPADTYYNEKELQLFCNNEIAPYCVLLPLHEFKEDHADESVLKAQHKFVLIQDSANFTSIEVQAFTIDGKNAYNTALFYNRDKRNVEAGGLGIDSSFIDRANHFYFIKGHLPNYMNMRYVQLNWILEDRIAVYFNYDEKEELLWNKRIAAVIKRGVQFSNQ